MPAKGQRRPPLERLMEKVRVLDNGCWEYTGFTSDGYGRFWTDDSIYAHVNSFLLHGGVIPVGLELDHTCHKTAECPGGPSCRHRRCVNPKHLEPVTKLENRHRSHYRLDKMLDAAHAHHRNKTQCPQGHSYDETNTIWDRRGHRSCRECNRTRARERARRLAAWRRTQAKTTPK